MLDFPRMLEARNPRSPKGDPSEYSIQNAILETLSWLAIPFSVTNSARIWTQRGRLIASPATPGWPDISATLPPSGRSFYIECKTPKGRPTSVQVAMHKRLREAGALVIVARSPQEVLTALQRVPNLGLTLQGRIANLLGNWNGAYLRFKPPTSHSGAENVLRD